MVPMWTLPHDVVEIGVRFSTMRAFFVGYQVGFLQAGIGSDAARNDGVDPLMLDRVVFDGLPVNLNARFLEDLRVLFQEGSRSGRNQFRPLLASLSPSVSGSTRRSVS